MVTPQDPDSQIPQDPVREKVSVRDVLAVAVRRESMIQTAYRPDGYIGHVPISIFHNVPERHYPSPVTIGFNEVTPEIGDIVLMGLIAETNFRGGSSEYILLPVIYLGTDNRGHQQIQLARPLAQIQREGPPFINVTRYQTEYDFGEDFSGVHTIANTGFTGYYMPAELELMLPEKGAPIPIP